MGDNWKEFEVLIHEIESALNPECTVEHHVYVPDVHTRGPREIDVLITDGEGKKVAIECRDRKATQDVQWIEQLYTKRISVGAAVLIAVSHSGFNMNAIKKAFALGILLRRIDELEIEDIEDSFKIPEVRVEVLNFECKVFNKKVSREWISIPMQSTKVEVGDEKMEIDEFLVKNIGSKLIRNTMNIQGRDKIEAQFLIENVVFIWSGKKHKYSVARIKAICKRRIVECAVTEIFNYSNIIDEEKSKTRSKVVRLSNIADFIGNSEDGKGKLNIDYRKARNVCHGMIFGVHFNSGDVPLDSIQLKGDFKKGQTFSLYKKN